MGSGCGGGGVIGFVVLLAVVDIVAACGFSLLLFEVART